MFVVSGLSIFNLLFYFSSSLFFLFSRAGFLAERSVAPPLALEWAATRPCIVDSVLVLYIYDVYFVITEVSPPAAVHNWSALARVGFFFFVWVGPWLRKSRCTFQTWTVVAHPKMLLPYFFYGYILLIRCKLGWLDLLMRLNWVSKGTYCFAGFGLCGV